MTQYATSPGPEWVKTGECFWMDDQGQLWLAESWQNPEGVVQTTQTLQSG